MPETEPKTPSDEVEVVKAREFDLTVFAKRVAVIIPVVAAAGTGLAEAFELEITETVGIALIAFVATVVLGASLVMAADLIARALATGLVTEAEAEDKAKTATSPGKQVVSAPPGTTVWVEGNDKPRPALAIATDGEKTVSYLVAAGSTVERGGTQAIDGAPKWHPAEDVRATRPASWP
jgi:hypothetical protein